jgi:hypothetical protein
LSAKIPIQTTTEKCCIMSSTQHLPETHLSHTSTTLSPLDSYQITLNHSNEETQSRYNSHTTNIKLQQTLTLVLRQVTLLPLILTLTLLSLPQTNTHHSCTTLFPPLAHSHWAITTFTHSLYSTLVYHFLTRHQVTVSYAPIVFTPDLFRMRWAARQRAEIMYSPPWIRGQIHSPACARSERACQAWATPGAGAHCHSCFIRASPAS